MHQVNWKSHLRHGANFGGKVNVSDAEQVSQASRKGLYFIEANSKSPNFNTLFDAAYKLYEARFPNPDERKPKESFIQRLEAREAGNMGQDGYHITFLMKEGEKDPIELCISGSMHLQGKQIGACEYIFMRPGHNGGKILLNHLEQLVDQHAKTHGTRLTKMVLEIDKPHEPLGLPMRMKPAMSPSGRADFYGNCGYKQFPVPYAQPGLVQGDGTTGSPVPLAWVVKHFDEHGNPSAGGSASPDEILAEMEAYHSQVIGVNVKGGTYQEHTKGARDYLKGLSPDTEIRAVPIHSCLWTGTDKMGYLKQKKWLTEKISKDL